MVAALRRGSMFRARNLAVLVSFCALTACSQPIDLSMPVVPTTLATATTTTAPKYADYSVMRLPGVSEASRPTTTVFLEKGVVTLSGVVRTSTGVVGGATVRIERIVGSQVGFVDVTADEQGRYVAKNIQGGRLRVRAWRSPDFSSITSALLFATMGSQIVDVEATSHGGTDVGWAIAPGQPIVGQRVNLAVEVTTATVGEEGRVSIVPLSGVGVTLVPLAALQPDAIEQRLTDERGRVMFTLTCQTVGGAAVRVSLATGQEATIEPKGCVTAESLITTTRAPDAPRVAPTIAANRGPVVARATVPNLVSPNVTNAPVVPQVAPTVAAGAAGAESPAPITTAVPAVVPAATTTAVPVVGSGSGLPVGTVNAPEPVTTIRQ